jgi:hypothetical protein
MVTGVSPEMYGKRISSTTIGRGGFHGYKGKKLQYW